MARLVILLALAHGAANCAAALQSTSGCPISSPLLRLRGGNIDSPHGYRRPSAYTHSRPPVPAKPALLPSELQPEQLSDAERVYVLQQFGRPEVRRKFVARVFSLVSAQCGLCVLLVAIVRQLLSTNPSLALRLYKASPVFFVLSLVPSLLLNLNHSIATKPPAKQALQESAAFANLLFAIFLVASSLEAPRKHNGRCSRWRPRFAAALKDRETPPHCSDVHLAALTPIFLCLPRPTTFCSLPSPF